MIGQRTRVEIDQSVDHLGKLGISGRLGGKPEMVSPRFELVGAQDQPNGFRGNGLDDAVGFELAREFRTLPLGERATPVVRSFTGQFHEIEGYFR